MIDSNLKALYESFDRLVDLPAEVQAAELHALRNAGDAMAFQLEGLLLCHGRQDPTASPFSIDEILRSCDAQQPFLLATDLRDLSQRMKWDEAKRCFRLGQYSLQQCLSVSAVGATYLAHDEDLDRDVVILLGFPRWNKKPLVPQRLLDSSRAVAKIFHPNVAAILGTLQSGDVSAVVRQWIPGKNLEEWIANRPNVSFSDLAAIGGRIARGLQAIHDQGVLHGDLKPANLIMRDSEMHPVITDFGTAHGIQPGGIPEWHGGTRGFVAPEILQGNPPSPQSDLYSLGVVLFWMATGMVMHGGDEFECAKAWERCLNRDDVTGAREGETALGELVLELLGADPGRRPQSAALVAETLEDLQQWGEQSTWTSVPQRVDSLTSHSERFHGGSRPLPWKRFRSRRAWMSHAIGLAACAAGSAWAGHLVASQYSQSKPRLFVPGTDADMAKQVLWDDTQFDPKVMTIGPHEPIAKESTATKAYASPISIAKWGTIASRPIDLPTFPLEVALFELEVRFNCEQGAAWVRVDMQLNESGHWRQIAKFRNLFGGSYDLPHQLELTKAALEKISRIRFRLSAMALRPALHPDGMPPVGLRMLTTQSPYAIGSLVLWKDANRPEDVI